MFPLSYGSCALSDLAGAVFAQNAPAKKTLVVNGRTADAAVVQIDGHSYVDLDTFARMINAALTFEPGRVILTVPATEAGAYHGRVVEGLFQGGYFPIGGDAGVEGRACVRGPVWRCRGQLARSLTP